MEIAILWVFLSIVSGVIAANKGRSFFGFFLLSIILSPLIVAIDRLDLLADCLAAVDDLISPDAGLHHIRRDKLSTLLNFLLTEQQQALSDLQQACRE